MQSIARGQSAVDDDGLTRCSEAQMDKPVHVPGFFFGIVIRDIETLDFTCELAGEVIRIKLRNRARSKTLPANR